MLIGNQRWHLRIHNPEAVNENKWLVLVDISLFSKCLLKMTAWFIISSEAIKLPFPAALDTCINFEMLEPQKAMFEHCFSICFRLK